MNRLANTVLILGGAGMVGLQLARESARELRPKKIVIAGLFEGEVRDAIDFLAGELGEIELVAAWGDIFLPQSLQGRRRADIASDREAYDELFREIFSRDADFEKSAIFKLISEHQPDVIIDSINTATAISYQDEFKSSERTYALLRAIEDAGTDGEKLARLPEFIGAVRELLISQGVPQIARHILFLHRSIEKSAVRTYVKVGTTGTGGMGLNIPYTHSEDKPSLQLLAKSAIGFAHTGLLFLLARTPSGSEEKHGAIIKEVKPGAMIGFRRVAKKHITLRGEKSQAYLVNPREEELGGVLQLRQDPAAFESGAVPLEIVGADTGENGFFSIGEFQAITYPRQMEYITPEEVARLAVLEIIGASTGRDVISAIDGAIADPSYRAGVLRDHALEAMKRLEDKLREKGEVLPSIAVGQLGPPKLSKLLAEAHLILGAAGTDDIDVIRAMSAEELRGKVEAFVADGGRGSTTASMIVTIGVPILRDRGGKLVLTRGPRVSIPPAPAEGAPVIALTAELIEKYAAQGWVDLRLANFELWKTRLAGIVAPDVQRYGSAALDVKGYPGTHFVPGDIVGWLLTNEPDEQGMIGRRLY